MRLTYFTRALLAALLLGGLAPAHALRRTPPLISTTSVDAEFRKAETRLASFIRLLQLDRRAEAVRYFSSRVPAAARRSFLKSQWLRRSDSGAAAGRVLFHPDLQIRTDRLARHSAEMLVVPRKMDRKELKLLRVRMQRENGVWRVVLRPEPKSP